MTRAADRLKDWDLETLRTLLKTTDPNGCYDDDERDIEDFGPLTRERAFEILDSWAADDPNYDVIGDLTGVK